jgi:hypothetical protein
MNVNFMVGRFQPLTNGHLECMYKAYKDNNLPTVICITDTKSPNNKNPFPIDFLLNYYNKFKTLPYITDIIKVESANIVEVSNKLHNLNYEPIYWICGNDRSNSYQRMINRYGPECHLNQFCRVYSVDRQINQVSATKARNELLNGSYDSFMNITSYESILGKKLSKQFYKELKQLIQDYSNG